MTEKESSSSDTKVLQMPNESNYNEPDDDDYHSSNFSEIIDHLYELADFYCQNENFS